ncbi:class I SAM-dependent methyltransferase [Thalassobellus suaedae]|uniref:Class I SAM-dependent methyltransferase n=1 Tax=Thalassobellus suaedae TaxID=3074124 RepID=A0ABY9XV07_9FLAO|nr:class I SAM-dependent methyltransferase [Flavobacteriaceae bacterium HL-DH14]
MKRINRILKYYNPKHIRSLFNRITQFEKKVELLIENPDFNWLNKNKVERMDALIEDDTYTNKTRRDFHLDRYKFASKYIKDKMVADIACGTGYGTRCLLEAGKATKCIGIDIDKDAVSYAQRNHNVKGSQFICSSAENVPLDNESVDVIVSFETLEHVHDENLFINEFFRLLKKDGILIISTPNMYFVNSTLSYQRVRFRRV